MGEERKERAEGTAPQRRRKSERGQREEDGGVGEERGESWGINRNKDKGQWRESKDRRRDREIRGQRDRS